MKHIALLSVLLFGGGIVNAADNMQFVTVLSSPVGTFSQLEVVHPETQVEVPQVNFCTRRSPGGTINLLGADAFIQKLTLKESASMGGTAPEFRINTGVISYPSGTIRGGRLLADTVSFEGMYSHKSKVTDTLYSKELTVMGAKTDSLTIPGQVQTQDSGVSADLEWSNIYTRDYSCNSDGTCTESGPTYTSYLLKSKRRCDISQQAMCSTAGGTYDDTFCICYCPDGTEATLGNGYYECGTKFAPKPIEVSAVYRYVMGTDGGVDIYADDELFSYSLSAAGSTKCRLDLTGKPFTDVCPADMSNFCDGCDPYSPGCNKKCYVNTPELTTFSDFKPRNSDYTVFSSNSLKGCVARGISAQNPSVPVGDSNLGSILGTGSYRCNQCGGAAAGAWPSDPNHNWWINVTISGKGDTAFTDICCSAARNKGTGYRCMPVTN